MGRKKADKEKSTKGKHAKHEPADDQTKDYEGAAAEAARRKAAAMAEVPPNPLLAHNGSKAELWLMNGGYSALKPALALPEKTLVLFHHFDQHPAGAHLCLDWGPLAQYLLLHEASSYLPPAVLVADIRPLFAVEGEQTTPEMVRSVMEAEMSETKALSKRLAKPVGRELAKLHLKQSTIVAAGECVQLVFKLLASSDSHGLGSAPGRVERLVLVHPKIQAGGMPAIPKSAAIQLDVVFETEEEASEMLPLLREAFPEGRHWCEQFEFRSELEVTLAHILSMSPVEPELPEIDWELYNAMGCSVWYNSFEVIMNRESKQNEQIILDIKEDLQELEQQEAMRAMAEHQQAMAAALVQPNGQNALVAALVVRGCRCILVRDVLMFPPRWDGMRLPTVQPEEGESSVQAAVRAVAEQCDLEDDDNPNFMMDDEVMVLDQVPPTAMYGPGGQLVLVYAMLAKKPPPPGPLNAADVEDAADPYDWYTFERASSRVSAQTVDALRTMSYGLAAAANAGIVPSRWGGVFGQELLENVSSGVPAKPMEVAPARPFGQLPGRADAKPRTVVMGISMEAALDQAESLLQSEDYAGAASAAEAALGDFKPTVLSRTALVRGKALLAPLLAQMMDSEQEDPGAGAFTEAWVMFMLALRFVPENKDAQSELAILQGLLEQLPTAEEPKPPANHSEPLDVIVVGAGASGVGTGIMLTRIFDLDPDRVLLLERGAGPGETFRRWPKEMRFISPSFNQQGWTKSFDLNSVAYGTSPAFTLHAEHPTGEQYANYLGELAEQAELNIQAHTDVTAVRPLAHGGFEVEVRVDGAAPTLLRSRYVVWAAGEFQYPKASTELFPGSEHCLHNSSVGSWRELPGDNFVVIGGYESGMDAAFNLSTCGKQCTVVSSTAFWQVATEDPSTELAPYTAERVRTARASANPPRLLAPLRVFAVEPAGEDEGGYLVRARWGAPTEHINGKYRTPAQTDAVNDSAEGGEISLRTPQPPVLCAGFEGSVVLGAARDLFAWGTGDEKVEEESGEDEEVDSDGDTKAGACAREGSPLLNEHDESTTTPGLFLVGPAVRHGELSFCFVYKFRQRFGIVAEAIARGLGRDTDEAIEVCRDMNMFMDDFACCKAACGEAC